MARRSIRHAVGQDRVLLAAARQAGPIRPVYPELGGAAGGVPHAHQALARPRSAQSNRVLSDMMDGTRSGSRDIARRMDLKSGDYVRLKNQDQVVSNRIA